MASQERVPDSQSNTQLSTQNVDTLTQSQDVPSQQDTLVVWGRLCSMRTLLKNFEMIRDSYTLGRGDDCDIRLTKNEMNEKWLNTISKMHFRIYRERVKDTNETLIYLEDNSQNGTFVDKVKVGRGNRVILENNSEIAVSKSNLFIYVFVNTLMSEINDLPPELKMKYAIGRKLGSGSCGEVRMVFTKDGSQRFAMKTIKKDIFAPTGDLFNHQMKNEVEILRKLKHSCIIKMEDIHDTPTAMYIVLELMEGGELFDRIKNRGKLTEPCAKLIFYQVVLAVYYLHKHGITHRDLKPENILLKSQSDKTLVKVSDFGLSKLVDARSMTMKTFCGTPMYVAPEILATLGRSPYTSQVDVWSMGVILYICLSGVLPFNNQRKDISLEEQIRRGMYILPQQYFGHLSLYARDLIKCMMTTNPLKRITVPQILLHPWLRDQCMREEAYKLMETSACNEQMINDENVPPSNNFENRRENILYPELKRTRFNM